MDIIGSVPAKEDILDERGVLLTATHVSFERIAVHAKPGGPCVALNWSTRGQVLAAGALTPAAARHLAARLLAAADVAETVPQAGVA